MSNPDPATRKGYDAPVDEEPYGAIQRQSPVVANCSFGDHTRIHQGDVYMTIHHGSHCKTKSRIRTRRTSESLTLITATAPNVNMSHLMNALQLSSSRDGGELQHHSGNKR